MKYIGSGLWALASAYLEVKGYGVISLFFGWFAVFIAFLGSNKSLVTVNQYYPDKDGE